MNPEDIRVPAWGVFRNLNVQSIRLLLEREPRIGTDEKNDRFHALFTGGSVAHGVDDSFTMGKATQAQWRKRIPAFVVKRKSSGVYDCVSVS